MHWYDAVMKSKSRRATRISKGQRGQPDRLVTINADGDGIIEYYEGTGFREANQYEIRGFMDWEPE